jgi:hypothetical protein
MTVFFAKERLMRRVAIGLVGAVALIGLGGCPGPSRNNDAGGGGIDANLPRVDAFVPACATMGPEDNAAACTDGCDNDGNGFADCNDFDCCSATTCGPDTACGRMPDAGPRADAFVLACPTMGPEDTAAACMDGCDNDGNGFVDCGDFDCCGVVSCGPDTACGRRPDGGPRPDAAVMMCPVEGPENTVAACGDGCDNDGNGFFDCGDFDCCDIVTCGPTTPCARRPDAGMCASGPENTLAACTDGCSNDGDRFVDCDDFDCCGLGSCAPCRDAGPPVDAGMCTSGPENTLAACSDGCSNDGDRFADCEDFDCCGVRRDCPPTSACGRRDAGT